MIHCLGSCLIIILKTIGNAIRFAEHLLIFHNSALCLLLKIFPVLQLPVLKASVKQTEHSAKYDF